MNEIFPRFLQGMAAAAHLLNKGIEKQSALECIVLQSNLIDGSLRMGLILKKQLNEKSLEVDEDLLKQEDGDPMIPERKVYQLALDSSVIDQLLFTDLSEAYKKRNKCIHRYLLCSIDYDFATSLVFELDELIDRVKERIYKIEKEQIETGWGMTVSGPDTTKEFLKKFAAKKEKPYNL